MDTKDYYAVEDKRVYYRIDVTLFVISFLIVLSKGIFSFWTSVDYTLIDGIHKAVSLTNAWHILYGLWIACEWLIRPFIIGVAMSFVTWQFMYMDSDVPGIIPPTPITIKDNYRSKKEPRFHLNYIFAIFVGPLTAVSLLLSENVSLVNMF